ncbi:MAG: caspase family protein [Armatimonadetes bacterium]|nr:caspase family protein [Armatimonadota bacterium]
MRPLRWLAPALLLLATLGHAQEPEAFAPARSWALVLGASKYSSLAPLKYAASDAEMFASSLKNDLGFDPATVQRLTDVEAGKLSSRSILDALDKMVKDRRLDPGHLFVFYFSGHGIGTPQGDYLCPTDADPKNVAQVGVSVRDIVKRFVDAGMHNVLIVADACREGQKNPFGRELRELGRTANIAVLLGCAPGQRSYENPRTGHGYFTSALAKVLADAKARDQKYGALWASAVAKQVVEQVSASTERQFGDAKQVPDAWSDPNQDVMLALVPPKIGQGDELIQELVKTAQDRGKGVYTKALRAVMQYYIDQRDFKNAAEVGRSLEGLGQLTPADRGALAGIYRFLGREREAQSLCAELVKNSPDSFVRDMALMWWVDSSVTHQMRRDAIMRIWQADHTFSSADMLWQHWAYVDPASQAEVLTVGDALVQYYGEKTRIGLYFTARLAQYAEDAKRAAELLKEARAAKGEEPAEKVMLDMEFELLRKTRDYAGMLAVAARGMSIDIADRWILNLAIGFKEAPLDMRKRVARMALKSSTYGPNFLKAVTLLRSDAYLLKDDIAKVAQDNPGSIYAQCGVMLAKVTEKFDLPLVQHADLAKLWVGDLITVGYLYGGIQEAAQEARDRDRIDNAQYQRICSACLLPFLDRLDDLSTSFLPLSYSYVLSAARDTSGQAGFIAERSLTKVLSDPQSVALVRALWFRKLISAGRLDMAAKIVDSGGWGDDQLRMQVRLCTGLAFTGRWDEAIERFNKLTPPKDSGIRQNMWALAHLNRVISGSDKDLADIDANSAKVTDDMAKRLVWMCRMSMATGQKDGDKQDKEAIQKLLPELRAQIHTFDQDVVARSLMMAWRGQVILLPERVKRDEYVLWSQDAREGNPLFDSLPWCVPSTVKDFVGTRTLKGTARFDGQPSSSPATLTAEVAEDGTATFTVEREGQAKVVLTGQVTRFGAFRATDGKFAIAGRLMPDSVAKLRPDVAREGVRMALWDEKCAQWTFQFDMPR